MAEKNFVAHGIVMNFRSNFSDNATSISAKAPGKGRISTRKPRCQGNYVLSKASDLPPCSTSLFPIDWVDGSELDLHKDLMSARGWLGKIINELSW